MEHAMREAAEAKPKKTKTKKKSFIENLIGQKIIILDDYGDQLYAKAGKDIVLVEIDDVRRVYVIAIGEKQFAVHYDNIGGIGTLSE